jgi:hypothetical protein
MTVWFEGKNQIECNIEQVKQALEQHGGFYAEIIGLMPGLTSVELLEQGNDFVTLRTNEGLMQRTNISKSMEEARVLVECDEEYQAGRMLTTKAHFLDEFTETAAGVQHRIFISDVRAPGLFGFFYRNFGRSSTGSAFLQSYKAYFEK